MNETLAVWRRYVAIRELTVSPLLTCAEGSSFTHLLFVHNSVLCGSVEHLCLLLLL